MGLKKKIINRFESNVVPSGFLIFSTGVGTGLTSGLGSFSGLGSSSSGFFLRTSKEKKSQFLKHRQTKE